MESRAAAQRIVVNVCAQCLLGLAQKCGFFHQRRRTRNARGMGGGSLLLHALVMVG